MICLPCHKSHSQRNRNYVLKMEHNYFIMQFTTQISSIISSGWTSMYLSSLHNCLTHHNPMYCLLVVVYVHRCLFILHKMILLTPSSVSQPFISHSYQQAYHPIQLNIVLIHFFFRLSQELCWEEEAVVRQSSSQSQQRHAGINLQMKIIKTVFLLWWVRFHLFNPARQAGGTSGRVWCSDVSYTLNAVTTIHRTAQWDEKNGNQSFNEYNNNKFLVY